MSDALQARSGTQGPGAPRLPWARGLRIAPPGMREGDMFSPWISIHPPIKAQLQSGACKPNGNRPRTAAQAASGSGGDLSDRLEPRA